MADPAPQTRGPAPGLGRGPAVIVLAVLMVAVLAAVLWASGMGRRPGPPAVGQPAYQLPDHSTTDTAPR